MSEKTIAPGSGASSGSKTKSLNGKYTRDLNEKLKPYRSSNPVAVRDYVTSYGYSGIVNWDGNSVMIGGKSYTPLYVNNGTAYLDKGKVDDAIDDIEKRSGIIGGQNVLNMVDERYGQQSDDALKRVINRDEFSYDPDNDEVYGAYKRMYEREAEDAMRRVFNDNNTSLTGASGAVLSEAMAKRDENLQKLTDKIPELAEDAYERYLGESERLLDNLDAVNNSAKTYYDRLYQINRDAINDLVTSGENERKEMQRWFDNERNKTNDYYDNELDRIDIAKGNIDLNYYDPNVYEALRALQLENEGMYKDNIQKDKEYAYENAASRGFYVNEDEEYLPWLYNYRTGDGSYSITPWSGEANKEYSTQKAKNRADYEALMYGY